MSLFLSLLLIFLIGLFMLVCVLDCRCSNDDYKFYAIGLFLAIWILISGIAGLCAEKGGNDLSEENDDSSKAAIYNTIQMSHFLTSRIAYRNMGLF